MQNEPSKYITRIAEDNIEKDLSSGKVILVLGARQVGKTTLVRRVMEGIKAVFLNFFFSVPRVFHASPALGHRRALGELGGG